MFTKLFIVAFTIIRIAVRPSVGQTAKEVMDKAYNDTTGGGVSLKFTLWRAANCPNEGAITRGTFLRRKHRKCYFCICDELFHRFDGNCDFVACSDTPTVGLSKAVIDIWNSSTTPTPSPWKSIREAVAFQVYSVDDGFCYATAIDVTTGRTMKCFAHR